MRSMEQMVEQEIERWRLQMQTVNPPREANFATVDALERAKIPAHPVITISREIGAGAEAIARQLCEALQYTCFDKEMIDAIAQQGHMQRNIADVLDETGMNAVEIMVTSLIQGRETAREEYLGAMIRTMQTLAVTGGAVLVGRGGVFVVGKQSALNILICANLEDRIQHVATEDGVGFTIAAEKVRRCDYQRRQFIKRNFKTDGLDYRHYDLVINTSRIPIDKAIHVILKALEVRGYNQEKLRMDKQVA